jgi:hypothetical protein
VPPLFEGPNGGHNLRGNGTLNLFVEPYEYGELSNMGWVGPNAKSGCSYNKSMTCKWIGTIRSKVLVQGGSVERVLIAPSASFDQRYIVDGGTGPTGPMGLHKPHMLEFSCNNVYLGEVPEWDGVSVPAEDRRPVETQFWSEYTRTWQQRNDCAVKGVYPFHITARDDNGNTGGIFGAIQNRQRTSNTEWFAGSADTIERHGVKFYSEGEVHLTGSDFDMTLFDRVDIIDNLEIESGKFDLGVINSQVFVRGGSIKYGGQINMDFTGQGEIEIMGMMTGGNSYQWRKSPSYPYSIVTGNATGASEEGVLMLQDEDNPGIIGIPKGSYLAFRGPTGSNVAGATRSGGRGPTIDLQGGGK